MIKVSILILGCFIISCSSSADKKSPLVIKTVLPKEFREISGLTARGGFIWAITDKPKSRVFKLNESGKLLQTINITNTEAVDVEAVTSDDKFLYIGDVGDNIGDRLERKIIRIPINSIPQGVEVQITGEIIDFTFPENEAVEKKKNNNFDCESMLSFKDSIYLFTKDREDHETKLYVIPKTVGRYVARYISSFNSKGLITDAAINKTNTEVALIGYHKGHTYPFIFLLSDFIGNDFFSGESQRIDMADKSWDWQLEGITYNDKNIVFFACEETKEVPATYYGIGRSDIFKLRKKKEKNPGKAETKNQGKDDN